MVDVYMDSGDLAQIADNWRRFDLQGITTNPSLLKSGGVRSYREFAKEVIAIARGRPVSFEVFADDFLEMELQALTIAGWGPNVWVKIPITNTRGESSLPLVDRLEGVKVNLTAVMTEDQIIAAGEILGEQDIMSIFQGRVMDTRRSPFCAAAYKHECKMLWASAREVYNIEQAESLGFDIITLSIPLLEKMALVGKDLATYSLETVKQFHDDSKGIAL